MNRPLNKSVSRPEYQPLHAITRKLRELRSAYIGIRNIRMPASTVDYFVGQIDGMIQGIETAIDDAENKRLGITNGQGSDPAKSQSIQERAKQSFANAELCEICDSPNHKTEHHPGW